MSERKLVAYELQQAVILAIIRGHRTVESIAKHANINLKQAEIALKQLNAYSVKRYGEPFVNFEEAVR